MMPCYHPLVANQIRKQKPYFGTWKGGKRMKLPCGQCIGCRRERCRQWAVRCLHEASLNDKNCFLTLTYDNEHLRSASLIKNDFVKFMKRLREQHFRDTGERKKIRYFMCGEYGEQTSRPHFHAIVFNYDFADKQHFKNTKSGQRLYISTKLENLWQQGHALIGSVAFESAAYVAGYIYKKQTGDGRKTIDIVDLNTGEITRRQKEYGKMSNRPGIGRTWLEKFGPDVYPEGQVISRGHPAPAPRYYDNIYKLENAIEYETMKDRRLKAAELQWQDNVPSRLRVKETVATARLALGTKNL